MSAVVRRRRGCCWRAFTPWLISMCFVLFQCEFRLWSGGGEGVADGTSRRGWYLCVLCCFSVNVGCGPAEERVLLTGLHAVADIYVFCVVSVWMLAVVRRRRGCCWRAFTPWLISMCFVLFQCECWLWSGGGEGVADGPSRRRWYLCVLCCFSVNVGCGPAEERVLLTGLHAVADIYVFCVVSVWMLAVVRRRRGCCWRAFTLSLISMCFVLFQCECWLWSGGGEGVADGPSRRGWYLCVLCCFSVNVGCGPAEERVLLTGLHAVADIYVFCVVSVWMSAVVRRRRGCCWPAFTPWLISMCFVLFQCECRLWSGGGEGVADGPSRRGWYLCVLCCFSVNVGCGPAEERVLLTGLHAVADIYCECCKTTLGWKYVSR